MRFKKKPVVIEATQWFKLGDHQGVVPYDCSRDRSYEPCLKCNVVFDGHGQIETLEGVHIVCPGDWIITGVQGEHYPCKPDIFMETYNKVEE